MVGGSETHECNLIFDFRVDKATVDDSKCVFCHQNETELGSNCAEMYPECADVCYQLISWSRCVSTGGSSRLFTHRPSSALRGRMQRNSGVQKQSISRPHWDTGTLFHSNVTFSNQTMFYACPLLASERWGVYVDTRTVCVSVCVCVCVCVCVVRPPADLLA